MKNNVFRFSLFSFNFVLYIGLPFILLPNYQFGSWEWEKYYIERSLVPYSNFSWLNLKLSWSK